ncbi:hypothetical protein CCHR01_00839 [Colletotrichum chrysophilum]|uniref:Uncharacterized protein n=1 Tax=Colletotrichum chrysophilum TaxID=1836956 RepID=A0AAD9B039_9PEZI|nr:hypothetical protein CCHR01_00839 [Colletotrichum chrysophilum]
MGLQAGIWDGKEHDGQGGAGLEARPFGGADWTEMSVWVEFGGGRARCVWLAPSRSAGRTLFLERDAVEPRGFPATCVPQALSGTLSSSTPPTNLHKPCHAHKATTCTPHLSVFGRTIPPVSVQGTRECEHAACAAPTPPSPAGLIPAAVSNTGLGSRSSFFLRHDKLLLAVLGLELELALALAGAAVRPVSSPCWFRNILENYGLGHQTKAPTAAPRRRRPVSPCDACFAQATNAITSLAVIAHGVPPTLNSDTMRHTSIRIQQQSVAFCICVGAYVVHTLFSWFQGSDSDSEYRADREGSARQRRIKHPSR